MGPSSSSRRRELVGDFSVHLILGPNYGDESDLVSSRRLLGSSSSDGDGSDGDGDGDSNAAPTTLNEGCPTVLHFYNGG